MKRAYLLILVGAGTLWLGAPSTIAAQGTTTFKIDIPLKTTSPYIPIGEIKSVVGLSDAVTAGTPVTFTFVDQLGTSHATVCSPACTPSQLTFADNESGSRGPDLVTVTQISGPAGDPVRYEMDFLLQSNLAPNSCTNTEQVPPANFYTVTISSAGGNKITGVCLESFDGRIRSVPLNSCTAANFTSQEIPIPLDNLNDTVATVDPAPQPDFACYTARPPLDVVMVLDKSGSMSTVDTGFSTTRMDALHSAVTTFLDDWAALSPSSDQVGIVTFDTTAALRTPLENIVTNKSAIEADVNSIMPGSSTSIGGGLNTANPMLTPASGRRKVALLMSDGQQNTDPFVAVTDPTTHAAGLYCENPASPLCTIPSTCTLAAPCPLSNLPQIYTVTLGPSITVDAAINFQIANATLGYYLNSETNGTLLRPFFLQLLQNFVRFNSYETVRMVSETVAPKAPYSASFPVSTTSHDVVFSLMWPNQLGSLRLTVTPPGGAKPIVQEGASGFISLVQPLPLPAPFDPRGDWALLIEQVDAAGIARTVTSGGTIPFDLHVMTDDAGIKTDLSVVAADYTAGNNIRLRAKVANFGLPITGLGSHSGDTIKADLIKPGQSIGDMLSDSTASSVASGPDPQTPAEAKLFNTLRNDPSALKQASDTVQLFDDGKAEHGDDIAGDGIYSALYPATLPGHYNFLFSIESTDPNSVRFARQQLRTAYVRSVPDASNTVFQTNIQRRDKTNLLSMTMTPRVKPGPGCLKSNAKCGRMGPGWANYFWFTAAGQTPFKGKDNLDGTYTATMAFSGSTPPAVSVHFENVLAVIGDSVTPDKLPAPLGPGNVLAAVPNPNGGQGRIALFFDAGANIPQGTFGSSYKTGFSLNGGLEYIATSHLSIEGIFGYHHFRPNAAGDLNLYQYSVNGKSFLTGGPIRPFVNAGIGGYKFGGASTYFGGNVGAGVLFRVSSRFGLEGSYNFHVIDTPVTTKFSTAQFGIRFEF